MRVSHALSLQTYLLILFASVGHNARHTQGAMLREHEKGTSLFVCTALDVCFRDSTQAVCCLLSILIVRASVLFCYQGDAAFWHNMLRSGEGDFRTRHAGCPVLKGWKWGKCMKRPDHARLHDTGVTVRTEVRTFIHSSRIAKQSLYESPMNRANVTDPKQHHVNVSSLECLLIFGPIAPGVLNQILDIGVVLKV